MSIIGKHLFLPKLRDRTIPFLDHARNTSFEKQLSKIPTEVKFCKKCVVSNQRPRIVFDDEGVCGACRWAEEKEKIVNWSDRKKQFEELLNKHRRSDGRYDVIVPCSGGKDSGMIAHKLKTEYGMHPLTMTWSPLLYTDIGFQNLQNMISSGLANHLYTPNRTVQRKFSQLGFVVLGNHFEAFGRGQTNYAFHVALEMDIKLVMYGENGELEYGGSLKNKDLPGQPVEDWVELYGKGSSLDELTRFGLQEGYFEKEDLSDPSLSYYAPPPLDLMKKAKVEFHWYGYYHKWVPQENFYYAAEHYGFMPNPEGHSEATYSKYASLDDLTDPFHYYLALIKFGIGRATSDAAHEIREGHITREEGVALVHRFDHLFPDRYIKEFLQYLDVTEEEFWGVIDAYRSRRPHLWDKIGGDWTLKHQVK